MEEGSRVTGREVDWPGACSWEREYGIQFRGLSLERAEDDVEGAAV